MSNQNNGIKILRVKGGEQADITALTESVKWSGRKGGSARSLTVTFLDDEHFDRADISVTEGYQLIFYHDGEELFRGLCMKQVQNANKKMTVTAYDAGIYLANNRDTFQYKKKTADQIFSDVCRRFGINVGKAASCGYKIKALAKSNTTAWDVLCDALSEDYRNTGTRHYILAQKGALNLLKRKENIVYWVLETDGNVASYSYTQSIEDISTRVKLLSSKGKNAGSAKNAGLEQKIGIFQKVEKLSDKKSKSAVKSMLQTMLKEASTPKRTLSIEAVGIDSVISGMGVYVIIPELNLKRVFYVDADDHTYKGNEHTMRLTLNYADDFEYD